MNRAFTLSVILGLPPVGCEFTPDWEPAQLGEGYTSQAHRQLERGRESYALYCAGCHGEKGDGNGQAARFLDPKPRDFRVGRIKFAAVASGEAPANEDYLRVITSGLAGTAMPSFALLSEQERRALVAYVTTFDESGDSPGATVPIPRDPWADDPAGGIGAGREVYHGYAKCWSCHPAYATRREMLAYHQKAKLPRPEFRPRLYESEVKDSQWGAPLRATDFLADRIKTGIAVDGLARVIGAGVGGTAMPTWGVALKPEQLWGLAHYVRSLALLRGSAEATALRRQLMEQPELPPPTEATPPTTPTEEPAQ